MIEKYLEEAFMFLLLTGGLMLTLILHTFYLTGWSIKGFKDNWEKSESEGKPIIKTIVLFLMIPVLIGAILFAVNVRAEEVKWFDEATVFVGLDYTMETSPVCEQDGASDRITSNLGFTQSIIRKDNMSVKAKYTHHSCAISMDSNNYDAIGVMMEWKIK